jgi:hypothetical protein
LAILCLVLEHLPLGIDGRLIDDELAWDILCYAALHQATIESACLELVATPSGNAMHEHLHRSLPPTREAAEQLEAHINAAFAALLPDRVTRQIARRRFEITIDLVEVPYHGESAQDEAEVRRGDAKCGTTHFHIYATLATIVHSQQRYTLALSVARAGETIATALARLLLRFRK